MVQNSPFTDLLNLIHQLPPKHASCADAKKREKLPAGRAGDLLAWLESWQSGEQIKLDEAHISVIASSEVEGLDAKVLQPLIDEATRGQAPVCKLCIPGGIGLRLQEMAVEMPHRCGDWQDNDVMAAIAFGMEATAAGGHVLGLAGLPGGGEVGSMAVICALLGYSPADIASNNSQQMQAVSDRLQTIKGQDLSALEVLRAVGGRDCAAFIGALVAARSQSLPVVVDGWAPLAALVILHSINASVIDHVTVSATLSDAFARAVEAIDVPAPLLRSDDALGMGTNAAQLITMMKNLLLVIG